jgi:predicted RNase H-like nuclease (RuvC/YqgF family)
LEPGRVVEIAIAVIGSGALTAIITAFVSRKRMGADAAQILSRSAVAMLNPMRKEVERLTERAEHLELKLTDTNKQLEECHTMVKRLHKELAYYRDRYGPPPRELL